MRKLDESTPSRPLPFFQFMIVLTVLAVLLGGYGFWALPPENPAKPGSLFDYCYAVAQIFAFGVTLSETPDSYSLIAARFLAVILFIYTLRAVFTFLRGKWHCIPLGNILVFGASPLGVEAAKYIAMADAELNAAQTPKCHSVARRKFDTITLIDPSGEALENAEARLPGVIALEGEAFDSLKLEDARLADARRIVIAMEDEMEAVAAAVAIGKFLKKERKYRSRTEFIRECKRERRARRYGLEWFANAVEGFGYDMERFARSLERHGCGWLWPASLLRRRNGTDPECGACVPIDCHIQINRRFQDVVFSRLGMFSEFAGHMAIKPFNPCANAARLALRDYPLDGMDGIKVNDSVKPALIISGCGAMGEALLLHAARIGHYANHKLLKVVVFDPAGEKLKREILFRHPSLKEIIEFEFHALPLEHESAIDLLNGIASSSEFRSTLAICLPNAGMAMEQALHLPNNVVDKLLQVLVRLDSEEWLRLFPDHPLQIKDGDGDGFVEEHEFSAARRIDAGKFKAFGMLSQMADFQESDVEETLALARLIHESYKDKARKENRLSPDLDVPWESLDPDIRQSNLLQAEHAPIKLRALGYKLEPRAPSDAKSEPFEFTLSDNEREALAEAEHRRWCADRLLAGWISGSPESAKDSVHKITPYLVPYDSLDEKIKENDRKAMKDIQRLVESGGFALRKTTTRK